MLNSSLFFRKIKPNEYMYITRIYGSKAYPVNYKEKLAIESLAYKFMAFVIALTSCCGGAMAISIKKGNHIVFYIYLVIFFFGCFDYRRRFKKIILGRSKVLYKPYTRSEFYQKSAALTTWTEIRKLLEGIIIVLAISVFSFIESLKEGNQIIFWGSSFFLIAMAWQVYNLYMLIYYKLKNLWQKNK